jgi:hypothetical protein
MPVSPDRILTPRFRPDRTGQNRPFTEFDLRLSQYVDSLTALTAGRQPWKIEDKPKRIYFPEMETISELGSLLHSVERVGNLVQRAGNINENAEIKVCYQLCVLAESDVKHHNFQISWEVRDPAAVKQIDIEPADFASRIIRGTFVSQDEKEQRPFFKVLNLRDRRDWVVDPGHRTGDPNLDHRRLRAYRDIQEFRRKPREDQLSLLEDLITVVNRTF